MIYQFTCRNSKKCLTNKEEICEYFNNCGEAKEWIYPMMTIVVSHKNKKNFSQNHYEFLRTDKGYKLISVTIENEKIK